MEIETFEENFLPIGFNSTVIYTEERNLVIDTTHNVLLVIVFLVGLVGNIFVCFTIATKKQMQTAFNLVLLSLAVGDIVRIFIESVTVLSYDASNGFKFNQTACACLIYFLAFGDFLAVIQVTIPLVISSFYPRSGKIFVIVVIVIAWTYASLAAFPYGYAADWIQNEETPGKAYCAQNMYAGHLSPMLLELIDILVLLIPVNVLLVLAFIQKIVLKRFLDTVSVLLIIIFIICSVSIPIWKIMEVTLHLHEFNTIDVYKFLCLFFNLTVAYKPILYILCDVSFKRECKTVQRALLKRSGDDIELS